MPCINICFKCVLYCSILFLMPRWSYGAPCTCSSVSGAFTVNTCYLLASGNLLHHMAQAQAPFSMESTWTYTRASPPARKCLIVLLGILVANPSSSHCECVFPPFDQVSRAMLLKEQRTDGEAMTYGPLRHQSRASSKTPNIIINLKFHFHDGCVSSGWKINAVMIISHFSPLHIFSNYHNKWLHHQFSVS